MPSVTPTSRLPHPIILVDRAPLSRMAFSTLIHPEPDLSLIGTYASAPEALLALESIPADMVVLEISDQDGSGFDLIRDLRVQHPKIRILILSSHSEILFAERVLQAGANGFISKADSLEAILVAIRRVVSGGTYCSPTLSAQLALKYLRVGAAQSNSPVDGLSNRELQVIRLIGSGLSTRNIAQNLGISIKTIETYIDHLKHKLGVTSGVALTHRAIQWMERGVFQ
jgi:DNA-binding NarL/FixJ family response regulator